MITNVKKKKGISLIVLVITIIAMIILAAAIILSLSNSSIISKANKAKTDSDTANLKEYVNTLRAEYELMTAEERNGQTFEAYANTKLEEKGYNKAAVDSNGEVYTNLTESATSAIKAGIKVGDTVTGYTLAAKTYETSGNENTAPNYTEISPGTKQTVTLKTDTQVTWKYIGIGEDGSLEITPDVASITSASPKMNLSGKGGYLNGPAELDKACAALYTVDGKGTAKSMNIDHVTRILGYTGEKGRYWDSNYNEVKTAEAMTIGEIEEKLGTILGGRETPDGKDIKTYKSDYYYINKTSDVSKMQNAGNVGLVYASTTYWLASPCVDAVFNDDCADFLVRCVNSTGVGTYCMFDSGGYSYGASCALRPVVSLTSNIQIEKTAEAGVWNIK